MKQKREKSEKSKLTRRNFLKTASGAAASILVLNACTETQNNQNDQPGDETTVYSPRYGITNPFINNQGQPKLVCVNGTNINEMLSRGLEALGGLGRLIGNNQEVLIKPNLNSPEPYPGISKVDGIKSIIREVKKVSGGVVRVGDQGFADSSAVYSYLNLENAVEEENGVLIKFSESDILLVRRDSWAVEKPDFKVYSEVYNSPIIINTNPLKRHFLGKLSSAIKNNVGTVQGASMTHTRAYLHNQTDNIRTEIAEIAGLINPELNIVDARTLLTVNGPFYSDGVPVECGKLILCGDMVATDRYCAQIMADYDNSFSISMTSQTLDHAELLGMGTADLSQVEIIEINT